MAMVGFIMITATGFAAVMTATGDVPALVESSVSIIGGNKGLAAFMMLLIGLFVHHGHRFFILYHEILILTRFMCLCVCRLASHLWQPWRLLVPLALWVMRALLPQIQP